MAAFEQDLTPGDCAFVQIEKGAFFLGNRSSLVVDFDRFNAKRLPEMKNMRFHHALTAVGSEEGYGPQYTKGITRGGIIVAGGTNGRTYLKIVEHLDFTTQKWRDIAPLRAGRALHTCCTVGTRTVIVMGGSNGEKAVEATKLEKLVVGKSSAWKEFSLSNGANFWKGKTNLKALSLSKETIFLFG